MFPALYLTLEKQETVRKLKSIPVSRIKRKNINVSVVSISTFPKI